MRDALLLNYHAVSPTWPASLAIDPRSLEAQLSMVTARGYRPVTAAALLTPQTGRTLTVTFDDGYASVLKLALPVLARLGVAGTVFVVTGFMNSSEPMSWPGIDHWIGTPHERELVSLNWDQIAQLADAGWEIGSHTRSHPSLTGLSDAELEDQLRGSRESLQDRLGRPCISLAYPYGAHDDRVVRAAGDAGYRIAFTVPERLDRHDTLRWPRIGVYREDSTLSFQTKISPAVRALRRSPGWRYLAPMMRRVSVQVRTLRTSRR
jgi:peptidoglycan/xylan/chitin deacetylase (PgdA/CDA1 family)